MANISCTERAQRLLQYCLDGRRWPSALLYEVVDECPAEFFGIVIERLADLFEPRLCDTYATLFSEAIAHMLPVDPKILIERYHRVRQVRKCTLHPANVFVLSRVTLGADIKVTSIVLDAAKRRFPDAAIYFVGGRKAAQLFEYDVRIRHLLVEYPREASLRDRLAPWKDLEVQLSLPDNIVIDPDSRLTQLGLLPICPEENYFFFESRAYGGSGNEDLSTLTRRWISDVFDTVDCSPRISPWAWAAPPTDRSKKYCTISLGVGDNLAKRIPGQFESDLLALIATKVDKIWVDRGAGVEEAQRVDEAVSRCGVAIDRVKSSEGSFAGFASIIAQSDLYVGYDSAGQHAAAACGVPLLSIFAGFPSDRFFARWRPTGPGKIEIVKVENPDPRIVLARVKASLESLTS